MDWSFSNIFWVVGTLLSVVILLAGIRRAWVFAGTSRLQKDNPSGQRAAANTEASPLEDFGEGFLAQELGKLRSQPSFYDMLISWLKQRSEFWLSTVLTNSWLRSFTKLTESARAQTDFTRHMAERSTIALENQKARSTTRADQEEQKLRGAQARHQRLGLDKQPDASQTEGTEDLFRKKTDEFARRLQIIDETLAEKIKAKVDDKPEAEWTNEEREYVEVLRNYCEKERLQLKERS